MMLVCTPDMLLDLANWQMVVVDRHDCEAALRLVVALTTPLWHRGYRRTIWRIFGFQMLIVQSLHMQYKVPEIGYIVVEEMF